ncbi:hypothetical protein BCR36DRAFT_343542 [Piromyces finnis]|uniref:G-protein coupled receptors family 3 profile domain-containing protein n=1 Tax=Piromyces finnis TaxID=1754191 RepID=A0A1Y1VK20_9FUNG|nr:hypothetical protein BCR36DRAFT_343542 [Piromyces finnis]|eukprot:ORX58395.1 hypothetical protein BCR36DRAFT_343542 [Piromyces finnis]
MFHKHSVVFLLCLVIWISINILQISAYTMDTTTLDPCGNVILKTGNNTLNIAFLESIQLANNFEAELCSDNIYYQIKFEEGIYEMSGNIAYKRELYSSYFEPSITRFGVSLFELRKSLEIIGKVNENNEPVTVFECPGIGYMGFIDVIHSNRNVTFKNIKFTKCYSHYFKIFHFRSFDDSTLPEYKFENCIFENNYDESLFFYEYLATEDRNNHVWNREKCGYSIIGEKKDCFFSENERIEENKEFNLQYGEKSYEYVHCLPSESHHSEAAIMITTPMYYNCHRNYGNCYIDMKPSLFVNNNLFEDNTGGERGLFDLRCLGAEFSNNKYRNNWGIDGGLLYTFDTKVNIRNEKVKDQYSYWGNSNSLYQVLYSNLIIRDSNYENIESQTSSIVNIQTINSMVYIYDTNFDNVIYPFEVSSSGAELHCKNCVIKNVKRNLSKNKPTIAQTSGLSQIYLNDTDIYNIQTPPLFKAIESSSIKFSSVSIHDVDAMENIGLISIVTSASVVFNNSKIYNIRFNRVLDYAYLISFLSSSSLSIKNTEIYDIDIDGDLIYIESADKNSNSLYIENSKFKNININTGSIIKISTSQCKFQIKNSSFIDNVRSCNSYDDITECSGVILVNTDLGESTIDNCLFQNNTSGIGPAITIKDIDHVELNIQNSQFIKNNAQNQGGALYISGKDYLKDDSNSLKMRNLEFKENHSNSGGAMYIDFPGYNKETIESTNFINNVADNGGGIFYFPSNITLNQPNLDKACIMNGNKALFGTTYSSDPYKIVLKEGPSKINSYSGESAFSFTLELQDEYGNIISTNFEDGSFSLQNMIFIKAVVINKDDEYESILKKGSANDVEIIGESFGYFQKGTCSFSMQFYSENINEYKLIMYVALSAYKSDDLYINIDLNMTTCPLGMYLKENKVSRFKGCVLAACEDDGCVNGICEHINENENQCKCDAGYIGSKCDMKERYTLSKGFSICNIILSIIGIIITVCMLIFILVKRQKLIVRMSGVKHLILISLGCIMGFSSIIFDFRRPTKLSCILRETLINIGSIMVYTILYLKIYYFIINNIPENISFSESSSLKSYGESKNGRESSMKVSKFEMSMDVKSGFNYVTTVNNNNANELLNQTNQNKKEIEGIANSIFRKQYVEGLKKNFHRIFSFILILFTLSYIVEIILYLKIGLKDKQMSNYLWAETCESLDFLPIPYAVFLLLIIMLLSNVRKLWSLSSIFIETKHICYAIGIWVTTGTLIQLICVSMIKQNPKVRISMMTYSIFFSFFIIDFFLIGLKVIAILKGGGDTCTYNNTKLTQFYNEPSSPYNNQGETTNSYRQ